MRYREFFPVYPVNLGLFNVVTISVIFTYAIAMESGRSLSASNEDVTEFDGDRHLDMYSRTMLVKSKSNCSSVNRYTLNKVGQYKTVTSPNWPLPYSPNLNCRYSISSPVKTRIKMTCHISMPHQVLKCRKSGDLFQYSLSGDETLQQNNTHKLCGMYLLTTVSVRNKLTFGFQSGPFNLFSLVPSKRNFKCKLKVIESKAEESPTKPQNFSCGTRFTMGQISGKISTSNHLQRIIGGSAVQTGEFPWRCALQIRRNGVTNRTCTCSIISRDWILSSTHCIMNEQASDIFISVGATTINENGPGQSSFLTVSRAITNNNYGAGQNDDTSLIRLSQPLVYSASVRPICLPCPFNGQQFVGAQMSISGFVESPSGVHTLLQKVLPVMDRTLCRAIYPINNDEICISEPGKMDCIEMGDSGSFADYMDPTTGLFYAAGVYSWGKVCASQLEPSVHQNVAKYIEWIESNTGQRFCPMS